MLLLLSACTGGDDDVSERVSNSVNTGGWIIILTPTEELSYIKFGTGSMYLTGISFLGEGFTCSAAFSLFYATPCDSDVTITWTNKTSGETGTGSVSGSCWAGFCTADWSATIKIVSGVNEIEILATDSYGNYGTDYLGVASVELSYTPENLAVDVPLDITVKATFGDPVSPPTSEDALYLTDSTGNRVDGTFLYDTYTYMFTPTAVLEPGMAYTANIPDEQITPYGNSNSGWRWSFTTVDGI